VKTKWNLKWDLSGNYVIFNELDEEGKSIKDFALKPSSLSELHHALRDWFGIDDRQG